MNEKFVIAMVRGDREINNIKLVNAINSNENYLRLATDEELASLGFIKGFSGPLGHENYEIYVDYEVAEMDGFLTGANEKDYHLTNVKYGRDFKGTLCDLKSATKGDLCPVCGKPLSQERGIEVGQIFKLQTKYSSAMSCTYKDERGADIPMVMGCYGIGVTRTLQSIVEQYHDESGIKWPLNVAPYHAVVVPVNYNDAEQKRLSEEIYTELKNNKVEVILDDRDERPGFKFKDWELIGIPFIIVCGRRANENVVEFKLRSTLEKTEMPASDAIKEVVEQVKNI